jgi:hypothetical protein
MTLPGRPPELRAQQRGCWIGSRALIHLVRQQGLVPLKRSMRPVPVSPQQSKRREGLLWKRSVRS